MKERCYDWMKEEDYGKHCLNEAKLLSIEKRQEFIDYCWNDHMCLGDAGKKADLNMEQYTGIMQMQIKSHLYLETTIKE